MWLGGERCFSHTNPSNTPRLLQSLILRYTAENLQVTQLSYGTHSKNLLASLGIFMAQRCRRGADVTKSLGEGKRKSWRLTIFLIITSFTGIACREPMQRREAYKQRWNHVEMLAWMLLHVIESPWPVNSKIHFRAFWNFLTNIMDGSCSSP